MAYIEDFFISSNSIESIPEDEYRKVDVLISSLEAISRSTYQSLYIIDYFKREFIYVSDNPLFLCGHPAEEIREMGYAFYMRYVPSEEQAMLTEINRAGFSFYEQLPARERLDYMITYDFHLIADRKKILVNHKLTPVLLSPEGRVWLAACVVSLSSHKSAGHIMLRKKGETAFWEYSLKSQKWRLEKGITLNEQEKEILRLSARGYTVSEIAEKLYLSPDTIKYHRRNLFDKLDVTNITEALSFATSYRLL